jgi:hypothetical protein
MVKEKVTKDDLLKFCVGDQKVFTLPSYGKARSAQSYANQQKKATIGTANPMEFRAIIGDPVPETGQCSITITRVS